MPTPKPCPSCGGTPQIWADAPTRSRPDLPYRASLYFTCSCGVDGPIRRSKHAAVQAWNEMVERDES